jgi:hypothetical protein
MIIKDKPFYSKESVVLQEVFENIYSQLTFQIGTQNR